MVLDTGMESDVFGMTRVWTGVSKRKNDGKKENSRHQAGQGACEAHSASALMVEAREVGEKTNVGEERASNVGKECG